MRSRHRCAASHTRSASSHGLDVSAAKKYACTNSSKSRARS